ncbi:MAG: hypothetical protein CBD58_00760, partial [bacterium TMED198]
MKHKIATSTIVVLLLSFLYSNSLDHLFLIEKDVINSKSHFLNINKPYLSGVYSLGAIDVDGSYNNQRLYSLYINSFSPQSIDSTTYTWFNYNTGSFDYMHTEVGAIFSDLNSYNHTFAGKGTSFRGAYSEHPNETLIESYYYNIGKKDSVSSFNFSYMYNQENLLDYSFYGDPSCFQDLQNCLIESSPYESASYYLGAEYLKKGRFFDFILNYQFKTGSYNYFENKNKIKQYNYDIKFIKNIFNKDIFVNINENIYNNSMFKLSNMIKLAKLGYEDNESKIYSKVNIVILKGIKNQYYSDLEYLMRFPLAWSSLISIQRSFDTQNLFNNALWLNNSLKLSLSPQFENFGKVELSGSIFSAKSRYHINFNNINFESSLYKGSMLSFQYKTNFITFSLNSSYYDIKHEIPNYQIANQESSFNIKNFNSIKVEYAPQFKDWKINPFSKIYYRSLDYGEGNSREYLDYSLLDISFGFRTSGFLFEYVMHNLNPSSKYVSDLFGHDEFIGSDYNVSPSVTFPLYQLNYFQIVWYFLD